MRCKSSAIGCLFVSLVYPYRGVQIQFTAFQNIRHVHVLLVMHEQTVQCLFTYAPPVPHLVVLFLPHARHPLLSQSICLYIVQWLKGFITAFLPNSQQVTKQRCESAICSRPCIWLFCAIIPSSSSAYCPLVHFLMLSLSLAAPFFLVLYLSVGGWLFLLSCIQGYICIFRIIAIEVNMIMHLSWDVCFYFFFVWCRRHVEMFLHECGCDL